MKKLLLLTVLTWSTAAMAQIVNGDFEAGTAPTNVNQMYKATGWINGCSLQRTGASQTPLQGTPDLCDRVAPAGTIYAVPQSNIDATNATNKRFAHLIGCSYPDPSQNIYGESIIGSFASALTATNSYTISFKTARTKLSSDPYVSNKIQIVLRKSGDCVTEKIVYTTPDIPVLNTYSGAVTNNWSSYSGTFTLTAQEAAQNFDKFEVRIIGNMTMFGLLVDDFVLNTTPLPQAAFVFTNTAGANNLPSLYGPILTTFICLPNVYINGSASINENSYFIDIAKFDLVQWIDEEILISKWITPLSPVPSTDINLATLIANDATYTGVFETGEVYRVRLAVGPVWHSVDHFFKADCNTRMTMISEDELMDNTKETIIYPVPASDQVTVKTAEGNFMNAITVFDLNGKQLMTYSYSQESDIRQTEIDLQALPTGYYIVEIQSTMGTERKQLIKK